jgi:hypothetical protein
MRLQMVGMVETLYLNDMNTPVMTVDWSTTGAPTLARGTVAIRSWGEPFIIKSFSVTDLTIPPSATPIASVSPTATVSNPPEVMVVPALMPLVVIDHVTPCEGLLEPFTVALNCRVLPLVTVVAEPAAVTVTLV